MSGVQTAANGVSAATPTQSSDALQNRMLTLAEQLLTESRAFMGTHTDASVDVLLKELLKDREKGETRSILVALAMDRLRLLKIDAAAAANATGVASAPSSQLPPAASPTAAATTGPIAVASVGVQCTVTPALAIHPPPFACLSCVEARVVACTDRNYTVDDALAHVRCGSHHSA